jgi:putative spermidine/putrescine transport system substrate-binding protein
MRRRSFLTGLGGVALGQGLLGCQSNTVALEAYFLRGTAPAPLFNQFQAKGDYKLELKPTASVQDLFTQLRSWRQEQLAQSGQKNRPLQVLGLGDYWLSTAIAQDLLQPLDPKTLSQWDKLPPRWQQLVRRDRQGQWTTDLAAPIWGAPYRWGMTAIVYRPDKFKPLGWVPQDWSDLWRPELRQQVSLLDSPREVIGLTLKKLGASYNTANPTAVPGIGAALQALNRQVKYYSSETYLQSLLRGETWLAVGWSHDILAEARQDPTLKVVIPQSGTALWADVWVQPKQGAAAAQPILNQWYDFWWQPKTAQQLSQFTESLSPLFLGDTAPSTNPPSGYAAQILLSPPDNFSRHEFLQPLSLASLAQFRDLWRQMRQRVPG